MIERMFQTIEIVVAFSVIIAGALGFPFYIIRAIRKGEVTAKGGRYNRLSNPAWFWITITMYGMAAVIMWGFIIGMTRLAIIHGI